ncbi:hypothetical protein AB0M02_24160 [Actinoplanes sp. NPDC051861]|uniref:hypothetical protein n=1 Tax=Actinoplanes sp. NPDC051861 TaxID=3155170 RepID=UPI003434BAF2
MTVPKDEGSFVVETSGQIASQRDDHFCLYLSGSVRKGDNDSRPAIEFWSQADEDKLTNGINARAVRTLNPSKSKIRRSDYYANFGCDLHLVSISNVVLVDVRAKRGIGIGAEMMFAQMSGIPVVSICPRNSAYRQDLVPNVFGEDLKDWIHPFVFGLSDYIVEDIDDAVQLINNLIEEGRLNRRPAEASRVPESLEYYSRVREFFERD